MDGIQKIIPVTKVKRQLLDIVKEMEQEDLTIAVTKNGEPVSVMMTVDRYASLMETIEILADPKIIKALAASKRDFKRGRVFSHNQVWAN